jgi:tetratricopeptide (TPR) repeat protein
MTAGTAEPVGTGTPAPSLGRAALSGRLEHAMAALEGQTGPAAAWKRAWLHTAAGRYGEALAECALAREGSPVLVASALMTEAMLYRQVSLHDRAEAADAEALATLRRARVRCAPVRAAIRVGQVADAVGLGAESRVLSGRLQVAASAVTAAGSWRQGVRLTWVRGEVLMVGGAYTRAARVFAGGAKVASDQGARRHHAKSLIFLAAARAASGDRAEARRLAGRGLQLAARCGAAPLIWPAELILAEVDPDGAARHLARARQFAAGVLATLPEDLEREALARPPASWLVAGAAPAPAPGTDHGGPPATDA